MTFDVKQLVIQRLSVQVAYHAAYTFWSLKGVLAEKWAHGPVFGAFNENPNQVSLSPAQEAEDRNIAAIYGLRASGINAEGSYWPNQVPRLADRWFRDVYEVLRPKKTIRAHAELTSIYPVRNPQQVSDRITQRYLQRDAIHAILPDRYDRPHVAVDWLTADEKPEMSFIMGVIGPPHRGSFFAFDDSFLENKWHLCIRLGLVERNDDGLSDPIGSANELVGTAFSDFDHVARAAIPELAS